MQMVAVYKDALGSCTVAFVSGIDTHHDVAVEVFTLVPEGDLYRRTAPQ